MPDAVETIQVGNGVVSDTADGIRFAGSYAFSANDMESARVQIAVWDGKSEEFDVTLHEGDSFNVAGQTWRLDKIHRQDAQSWYADLTRIA